MANAADVPTRFDVVIDGQGYVFADDQDVKAELGVTPTFVTRQNVQGDYGDNQQDFWLTETQRDWSLGEQQRYFRQDDDDAKRRYWQGTSIEIAKPGEVRLASLTAQTSAFGAAVTELAALPASNYIVATSTANFYWIAADGTITSDGAHGLGTAPTCICAGGSQGAVYLSSAAAGSVGIRRHVPGGAFTTFSATPANSLAFLNNALYGMGGTAADGVNANALMRWDTGGTATTLFQWKDASGNTSDVPAVVIAYGGGLVILRGYAEFGSELWLYNGTAPALITQFPNGFVGYSMAVLNGTIFVAGLLMKRLSGTFYLKPAIFYYANGSTGLLWKANDYVASTATQDPRLCVFNGGLVFTDDTLGALMFYEPSTGGVSTIGTYTFTAQPTRMAATRGFLLQSRNATQPYRFPSDGYSTSGTVMSSLFDFDSSLDKRMHAIRVDFDLASDGNGGSVDVAYRLNDVDGSYTSLATGVTSGVEIDLSNVSGRSISVKVTLNKGTSTAGPVLKRIAVRASAIQPQFERATYVLNCTGTKREPNSLVTLRDGQQHGLTGLEMVANLKAAAAKTNPISIIDATGTVTGIIEDMKIQAVRRAEEFVVQLTTRGV